MIDFFKELFHYNHHYNQQLITIFLQQKDKTSERSVKWLNHILNAHYVWNSRVLSVPGRFTPWQIHLLEELQEMDRMNHANSIQVLDRYEPDIVVNYVNFSGQAFGNTVRDILFHVVNHSTYHRGQIAADFRQQGIEPLVTDYIFYKRQPL